MNTVEEMIKDIKDNEYSQLDNLSFVLGLLHAIELVRQASNLTNKEEAGFVVMSFHNEAKDLKDKLS